MGGLASRSLAAFAKFQGLLILRDESERKPYNEANLGLLRAWPLATFIINKGKMKRKEPPSLVPVNLKSYWQPCYLNDKRWLKVDCRIFLFFQDTPDSVVYQAPASTAATQVRIITRDMTGKNVWDFTLLHGSSATQNGEYQYTGKMKCDRLFKFWFCS